jgi:hypothetical protein
MGDGSVASGYLVNRALENLSRTLYRGPRDIGEQRLRRSKQDFALKRAERLAPIEEMQATQAERWLERDQTPLTLGALVGDSPDAVEHLFWTPKSPSQILEQNKDKPFVKRILKPSDYPSLDLGEGRTASHLMTWAQVGDKYVAFPTVLQEGKKLKKYIPDEAWSRVKDTGNYIEFNTAEEADKFSKEYKNHWKKDETLVDKIGNMLNADPEVTDQGTLFMSRETGQPVSVGDAYRNWPQIKALYMSSIGIDRKLRSMKEGATDEAGKKRITDLENDPAKKIQAANKIIEYAQQFAHYPDIQSNITRLQSKIAGWEKTIADQPGKEVDLALKRAQTKAALSLARYRDRMPVGKEGEGALTPAQSIKANRILINDAMKHLFKNLGLSEDFIEMSPEQKLSHTNYLNIVGMLAETNKYTGNPALLARDAEKLDTQAKQYAQENIAGYNITADAPEYQPMVRALKEDFIVQQFGGMPDPNIHDGRSIRMKKTGETYTAINGQWVRAPKAAKTTLE